MLERAAGRIDVGLDGAADAPEGASTYTIGAEAAMQAAAASALTAEPRRTGPSRIIEEVRRSVEVRSERGGSLTRMSLHKRRRPAWTGLLLG